MSKKKPGQYFFTSFFDKRKRPDRTAGLSEQCATIADSLNRALEIFTSHSESALEGVMDNALGPIADAAGLHRVAIYRLLEGKTHLGQTYVWANGKTSPLDRELIELPDFPPVIRWVNVMMKGDCVNGRVDEMLEEERAFLSTFNVKSIFMVPVFTHNEFWGFVTLEDQVNYRYFGEECLDLLCSAARLCASAFIRTEMTRNAEKAIAALERREKLINTLNETAILFLSQREGTFEYRMTEGVRLLVTMLDLDRFSVWRNTPMSDGLHVSQVYRWDKLSQGTTSPTESLTNITYADFAPRWEKLLAEGGSINSPVHLLPEAAMLQAFGVISAFVTPVFINNTFWGFVLFEDRYNERYFDEDHVKTMRSAALLFTNAVLREEMEQEIADANEFNRTLLDAAPIGFTIIDENLDVLDCNNVILDMVGATKKHYSEHFLDFSPEYQEDGQKTLEKADIIIKRAMNGEKLAFGWLHRSSDGELIPAEVTLVRMKYRGKYAALAYQYDLRNIKKLEQEIADTNEFNRALIDAAPIALTVIDDNLNIVDCNNTTLKLCGGVSKEYYLNHFIEFSAEYQPDGSKSKEKVKRLFKEALDGKEIVVEWINRTASGDYLPSEVTLVRVKHKGAYRLLGFQYDISNIKKMEQEISEANAFNRALIDTAPIGLTVLDDNLNVIDCNNTIVELCGSGSRQYYMNHFYEFSTEYQPDGSKSQEKAIEHIRRALSGEKVVIKWEHCTITGESIPSEVTLVRVKHRGRYIALGYQYDLRNIKKMEQSVADAEELARAIKEASPISYVLFDENLCAIDCNDATLRIFDCPDKQFLLDHYWDLFLPESQPDGNESYGKAMLKKAEASSSERGQSTFEWVHRAMNGELIPMENTLTEIVHKDRKFVISFKYDLRSTKKMMENIREQSEQLKIRLEQQELISEISRGFIASGDSEIYVKEAIAKLGRYHDVSLVLIFRIDYQRNNVSLAYHWAAKDVSLRLGQIDLLDVARNSFPERLPDCATVPVIACSDTAASTIGNFRDLQDLDVNAFICAPLYVEGRLWGLLSVEQCFYPRQWAENEKGFVAITASTIAGVIMRDIYNSMLKDALHKATVASKAKGEFLSNMSHEMRTPLNAIIGMTSIGKNAEDLEHKDYALDKIDNASAHLLGVINDVLDMSKIEANMLELSPVEYNFEKMLQKVASVINFRVDEKKQQFKVHIDRAIPKTLIGDDQRLSQVITNLLGNAVKFTPEEGSITLNTRFLGEVNNICTIEIDVIDTGIGIDAEQQKKLFRSFQQAETSTTRKFGGTGLGLAISKSIVEMMGGQIWIKSETGKGSTFGFTIQAQRGVEKKHRLLSSDVNLSNVRVMVVDDDPDILEYLKEIAQRFEIFCDTAISGEDALCLVEQNGSYDIYFVDWKMPGIDGIALTARLKEKMTAPGNAVVVMISAAEWNAVETEAKKAGVDKFLSKPLFPSVIADIISECLGIDEEKVEQSAPDFAGSFAGHCILLAEDVEINREIVLTLLEPTLLEIDCAENGVEAVRMFKETPEKYDAIFMDVQMPEMDGYEATRQIRVFEKDLYPDGHNYRKIPIIAMTANVFREDIEKSLAAGMDDHIGKPLDFDIVLEKLRVYLSKQ